MKKLLLTGLITLSLAGLVVGCGNKEVTKKNMPSKTEPVSSSTSSNELKNNEIKESEDKAKSATKTKDETKPKEEIEVIKNEVKKINNKPQNEVKGNKTDYKSKNLDFHLLSPKVGKVNTELKKRIIAYQFTFSLRKK